jgi:hypothetical protein
MWMWYFSLVRVLVHGMCCHLTSGRAANNCTHFLEMSQLFCTSLQIDHQNGTLEKLIGFVGGAGAFSGADELHARTRTHPQLLLSCRDAREDQDTRRAKLQRLQFALSLTSAKSRSTDDAIHKHAICTRMAKCAAIRNTARGESFGTCRRSPSPSGSTASPYAYPAIITSATSTTARVV